LQFLNDLKDLNKIDGPFTGNEMVVFPRIGNIFDMLMGKPKSPLKSATSHASLASPRGGIIIDMDFMGIAAITGADRIS
jgi:hypothetical protein